MQRAMDTLDGFLKRHSKAVLGLWLAAILAAVPFAMRQTDHLSSGGFGVPGSGSKAVDNELARFPGVSRDALAVVLQVRRGARVQPAVSRVARIVRGRPHVVLTVAAKRRALAQRGRSLVVMP